MLKKIHDRDDLSLEMARKRIPRKKALFIVTDMSDMSNIQGYISYISESENSYDELVEALHRERNSDQMAMIIGSYENGGAIGVQYCR